MSTWIDSDTAQAVHAWTSSKLPKLSEGHLRLLYYRELIAPTIVAEAIVWVPTDVGREHGLTGFMEPVPWR